ncbi:unnamed protein product [Adineta steineri]|uniref:mitogen-activated protein kinase kinase kinase n=1 Tax=Adineta steineri TaxID=433720 RepID=A0A814R220_9BILA|nr:unnamed protein product [Adineta steineri]
MHNSSSSSNNDNNNTNNNNNNNNQNDNTKENMDGILDVMFDYTGNGDDELTIRRGNKLEVLSKDESISGSRGWWTGRLVDTNSVGIFPANFVANSKPNLRIIDYNDIQIGDTIGVGGFGHVFHGKFGDIDVAIKTAKSLASFRSIQPTTTNDDTSHQVQKSLIDSLLREARLFSNLEHRNIIQLFGVSPSLLTKNLYLIMQYAHGGALNQLLQKRQSGLYPNVFIKYAKQIADGMKYLHEEACEHIIHRDLKCSNILILEQINDVHDDNDLLEKTLKITDFGLARIQLQSSSMSAAGTFAWMSPECIRNSEYSTKSDVWSFGVLLWECLTGELPYKGFDQMQVAFGIATNKYSLPIPTTCPDEFSQLMTNCWKLLPSERPTFSDLLEQIDGIIERNYMEANEESYQSLQQDWRQEIQDMFNELKEKEQEIRDREQAMHERSLEQNHQRLQLEKWEQQLHEREMHIVELELKLLMATNNQERTQHQTPKVQKRSGRFMRSLLNGNTTISSNNNTIISSPTNFRHLISVCHNHLGIDHSSSPTIPTSSTSSSSPISCAMPSNSSITILSNSSNKSFNSPYNCSFSSNSTPSTPNINRLRTLTFHFPVDGYNSSTPPEKPPRSSSQTKSSSRKSKSSISSSIRQKYGKSNARNGEPKWYLDTLSPTITNNNDNLTTSSTISTPIIDRQSRKLVSKSSDELNSSSSSSLCSTPNDRSLARALFDINSMLINIGLGRRAPSQLDSSTTITSQQQQQSIPLRSTNEIITKKTSSSIAIERTSSSSIVNESEFININYKARPSCSPVRPNSLVLSSSTPQNSSQKKPIESDDDYEKYYSAQSSNISTPIVHHSMDLSSSSSLRTSQEKLILSSILDIDNEEQQLPQIKIFQTTK